MTSESRRDDLDPQTRAVADTLDDWMMRHHGVMSSRHNAASFLRLLAEEGYEVRLIEAGGGAPDGERVPA